MGQQIWTTGSDGTFQNTGAQADLWCGPGSAKIAIKHFFSNTTTGNEVSRLQCGAIFSAMQGQMRMPMQCCEASWHTPYPICHAVPLGSPLAAVV